MTHIINVLMADGLQPGFSDELARHGCRPAPSAADADVLLTDSGQPLPVDLPMDAGIVVFVQDSTRPTLDCVDLMTACGIEVAIPDASRTTPTGLTATSSAPAPAALDARVSVVETVGEDLLARVDPTRLTPISTLTLTTPATALLRLSGTSRTPGPAVAATGTVGDRRIVVLAVQPDSAATELLVNAIAHAARRVVSAPGRVRGSVTADPAWLALKNAVTALRPLQAPDGSITQGQQQAAALIETITTSIGTLAPRFPRDADYLNGLIKDFYRWVDGGLEVPDFLDSLLAFHPERDRVDGREHLVVFPMYTQNGNPDRNVEAVLIQVIWPEFVADLEAGDYSNKLFVPIRFLDFTPGYNTNSAVLFPETVAMREVPKFSWGAIFADREAARFRKVVTAAADITSLALPPDAARLLGDQELAEQTFVMWDLIHDRTHMHGDLPFDPFMIKQRMPYFLYTLEELRCDLTAFAESVALEAQGVPQARGVQYAILFDRIFRFPISGSRVRNYDGLGGQLLFAWLHQHHVLHWTDNRLTIDWSDVTEPVLELGRQIELLYWQSIDRPKTAHWLAAYDLVAKTLTPNPSSVWAQGPAALPLDGPPRGLTDAVLPDEFPLSMFYEALNRKLSPVVAATAGITG